MTEPENICARMSAAARRARAAAEKPRRETTPNLLPAEHGGPKGSEPTRCGDGERDGHAVDF